MDDSFWTRLSEPTASGCREWQGYRLANGYGQVKRAGRSYQAHRYAWEEMNGPIPLGMIICHRCDNRACCNPDHLWLGTNKQNSEDMVRKWRAPNGERGGQAKLSNDQVKAIREDTRTTKEIAADYNVHWSSIAGIKAGKTWRHIKGKTISRRKSKITEDMVRAIRSDPRTNFAIADAFGLSFQQVSKIKRRERWAHVI
ncbi:MAG: HNH endonuclease signature motif containing protein [Pseudomonadota bacterium]